MKKETIIRLALLIAALINQALVTLGYEALPWSGDDIGEAVSTLITAGTAAWAWWRNNSTTKAGWTGTRITRLIKEGVIAIEDAQELIENAKKQDDP
jgi:SPP1 family holin